MYHPQMSRQKLFFPKLEKMMRIKFNRSRGNNWLQNNGGMNSTTSENAKNKLEEDKVVALSLSITFSIIWKRKSIFAVSSPLKHKKKITKMLEKGSKNLV